MLSFKLYKLKDKMINGVTVLITVNLIAILPFPPLSLPQDLHFV